MLVLYKCEMYSLDMTYLLFVSMQESHPEMEVELVEITSSTYKGFTKAKIGDLMDYSVARNLAALRSRKQLRKIQRN